MPGVYLKPAPTVTHSGLPCQVTCSMVQKLSKMPYVLPRHSSWIVFVSLSRRPCSLAVALHTHSHCLALITEVHVGVDIHCEIFESADLKFLVSGWSKHSRIHTRWAMQSACSGSPQLLTCLKIDYSADPHIQEITWSSGVCLSIPQPRLWFLKCSLNL